MKIRPLLEKDWDSVAKIYSEGIATGIATFETDVPDWEHWNKTHMDSCRIVAGNNDEIWGWAALTPVSGRCVYAGVAEVSVYVSNKHHGKGVGTALLKNLISLSEKEGIWTLQSGIFTENTASLKLHQKAGFRMIGLREKIGRLKGVWKDNYILERRSKIVGIN
ncbi:GNAT family N-acetyltransferase [Abyssalbus ytuae]|uniref:N-acetyltransferase family protein n=1 Tax=Abyssalbus ytuae TaxID=2926907 RepID=A0A9E6ZKE1_9FLAO|nr:GNAT family N-acetyltransferase [Abyssalbus ytuae]UOB16174.1 N-acetyltransferase family protein [Abyssalbus ytuae]